MLAFYGEEEVGSGRLHDEPWRANQSMARVGVAQTLAIVSRGQLSHAHATTMANELRGGPTCRYEWPLRLCFDNGFGFGFGVQGLAIGFAVVLLLALPAAWPRARPWRWCVGLGMSVMALCGAMALVLWP